jgi:hypothetical protein
MQHLSFFPFFGACNVNYSCIVQCLSIILVCALVLRMHAD